MSNEVRIGGVTARFNEDGTLYIYQPDSNRALSSELTYDLLEFLAAGKGLKLSTPVDLGGLIRPPNVVLLDSAVDSAPSTGAVRYTIAEAEEFHPMMRLDAVQATLDAMARDVADVADTEPANTFVDTRPVRLENPTQKQMAGVAAELGLPTYGTKAQLAARLMKAGVEIVTG